MTASRIWCGCVKWTNEQRQQVTATRILMKNARAALEDAYALAIAQGATPEEAELIAARAYTKTVRKGREWRVKHARGTIRMG